MSLGYKRKTNEENDGRSVEDDSLLSDPLFEADWDEFVIKFDEKRGKYNVETAVQASGNETSESARS